MGEDEVNMTQKLLYELQPLFEKAEKEGLWFFSSYYQIWFSPKELKKQHKEESFLWGAVNWKLLDPNEELQEFDVKIEACKLAEV